MYPNPGFVMVTVFRLPLDTDTVAVAVVNPAGGVVEVVIE